MTAAIDEAKALAADLQATLEGMNAITYKYPIGFEFWELSENRLDRKKVGRVEIEVRAESVQVRYVADSSVYTTLSSHTEAELDKANRTPDTVVGRMLMEARAKYGLVEAG